MEIELANTARAYIEPVAESLSAGATPGRPIDLVHLSKQTFGERDLEGELLRLFDRQAAQILARLSDGALPDRRWRADLAHTLKGSARAIGAFAVAAAAQAYEEAVVADLPLEAPLAALGDTVADAHRAIADLLGG
jgi:HPt (histidine-containing phosphotransfer) domain-containing protein